MKNTNDKDYKFKAWEKLLISIITPIFLFLSTPFTIIFAIGFAFIILAVLGPIGLIFLGIAALLIYSIIKSALDD